MPTKTRKRGRYCSDSRAYFEWKRTRRKSYVYGFWPLSYVFWPYTIFRVWCRLEKTSDKVFWLLAVGLAAFNVYVWTKALS